MTGAERRPAGSLPPGAPASESGCSIDHWPVSVAWTVTGSSGRSAGTGVSWSVAFWRRWVAWAAFCSYSDWARAPRLLAWSRSSWALWRARVAAAPVPVVPASRVWASSQARVARWPVCWASLSAPLSWRSAWAAWSIAAPLVAWGAREPFGVVAERAVCAVPCQSFWAVRAGRADGLAGGVPAVGLGRGAGRGPEELGRVTGRDRECGPLRARAAMRWRSSWQEASLADDRLRDRFGVPALAGGHGVLETRLGGRWGCRPWRPASPALRSLTLSDGLPEPSFPRQDS